MPDWEDNNVMAQAMLIGYNQVRDYETQEETAEYFKAMSGAGV